MTAKFLFFLLLGIAIYLHFKGKSRAQAQRRGPAAPPPQQERPVELMVACCRCGLLLPESEALMRGVDAFCCEEHRRLGP